MSQTNVAIVELKALKFWLAKSKKIEVNPNAVPNLKHKLVVKNSKYSNFLFFLGLSLPCQGPPFAELIAQPIRDYMFL
ncbi:MAG: hypothetical protein ACJAUQ_000830 [Maribacter sp.]|jgi:hypothetical protein